MLTAERLRAVLHYDPETGIFCWLAGQRRGEIAGHLDNGYLRITVDGSPYRANRLAWLFVTGEWPIEQIDHRNLARSDNRWTNLRQATNGQNKANSRTYRNNQCGVKGVHHSGDAYRRKPWRAIVYKDGKTYHLGRYATQDEAGAAYAEAADRLHGEFARAGV